MGKRDLIKYRKMDFYLVASSRSFTHGQSAELLQPSYVVKGFLINNQLGVYFRPDGTKSSHKEI